MKKLATRLVILLILISSVLPASLAATVSAPVPAAAPATSEPDPNAVKDAMNEFKHLSRSDRRSRLKEAKKMFKEYKAAKKRRDSDADLSLLLLAILAILLPPLAVYLKEGEFGVKFWISLLLLLLTLITWPLWFVGVVFALLVVFDAI